MVKTVLAWAIFTYYIFFSYNLIFWQNKLLIIHSGTEKKKKREHKQSNKHFIKHLFFPFPMLKFPYFHCRLRSVHHNSPCEAQEVWGCVHDDFCPLLHAYCFVLVWFVFLLISASCWFSSAAFCFGVSLHQNGLPTSAVAFLRSLLHHGQPWTSFHIATPPDPTTQTCPLCPAQVWGSPWAHP